MKFNSVKKYIFKNPENYLTEISSEDKKSGKYKAFIISGKQYYMLTTLYMIKRGLPINLKMKGLKVSPPPGSPTSKRNLKKNKKYLERLQEEEGIEIGELFEKDFKIVRFKTKCYKEKFIFKNDIFFFVRKFFNSFIKKGKKYQVINYFLKIFFFINLKALKNIKKLKYSNKTQIVFLYFYKLLKNILPIVIYTNLMFRGENIILPWIIKNKKVNRFKLLKIAVSWIKKSVYKRKEKTLYFKIISELEDLRLHKGASIENKKDYYQNFYKKKYYIKFLKKRSWI